MDSRKRSLDGLARGQSPPEKRTRPPDRSDPFYDRCATPKSLSFPSPPLSRKNSLASPLSHIPTGPTAQTKFGQKVDHIRTISHRDSIARAIRDGRPRGAGDMVIQTDFHVASPGSIGSGASTPAQSAPPAPSMLPMSGGSSSADHLPQQEQEPITMASLRNMKLRKQAIANNAKPNGVAADYFSLTAPSLSGIQQQLTAQQLEITQLRTEREEMLVRIKELESLPDLVRSLSGHKISSSEQCGQPGLVNIPQNANSITLQTLPSEPSEASEQYERPKLSQSDVEDLRTALLKCNEDANTVVGKMSMLEKDFEAFKGWKDRQSDSITLEQVKSLVRGEIKSNESTISEANSMVGFRERQEKRNNDVDIQLKNALRNLDTFARREEKTWSKALATEEDLAKYQKDTSDDIKDLFHEFDKYVGSVQKEFERTGETVLQRLEKVSTIVGQVRAFQGEHSRLFNDYRKASIRQDDISRRIEVLETNASRVSATSFQQRGTSGQTNINDAFKESMSGKLAQLDDRISNAEGVSDKHEGLAADVKELCNRMSIFDQDRLSTLKAFDDKLAESGRQVHEKCEELARNMVDLDKRVSDLRDNTLLHTSSATQVTDLPNPSDISRISHMETDIRKINQVLEQLDEALQKIEQSAHEHSNQIDGLQESVPALFKEKFDPLQHRLEDQLAVVRSDISAVVQTSKDTDVARDQGLEEIKKQLASKPDNTTLDRQLDAIRSTVRNLTDQYNNITTDALYQQMVHWFVQQYPSNSANMVRQFSAIQQDFTRLQQDIASLQPLTKQLSWIQSCSPDLSQTWAKVDQAWENATAAVTKSEEAQWKASQSATQVETIQATISSLQTLIYNINAKSSSFAKTEQVNALEKSIEDWQAHTKEAFSAEHESRTKLFNEVRSCASREHDQRAKAESQMRTTLYEVKKTTDSLAPLVSDATNLINTVETMRDASSQLRGDFDAVNNRYIEPNKDFFDMFATIIVVVKDLQRFVESINQNLDHGPLKLDWAVDFNAPSDESERGTLRHS